MSTGVSEQTFCLFGWCGICCMLGILITLAIGVSYLHTIEENNVSNARAAVLD
jgi:hypothetical protein